MTIFISQQQILEHCDACEYLKRKIGMQSGKPYFYCNQFSQPCFKCLRACKDMIDEYDKNAYDEMERCINRMESRICRNETAYEPDYDTDCDDRPLF